MPTVVKLRLVDPRNEETIRALRALLARAERGELTGIAVCYHTRGQGEQVAFTGKYRERPSDALAAGMRMSHKINMLQEVPAP